MTITNGYCTLAEFKADKRITSTDATDDTVIEDIITDASRLIDAVTGRHFYAVTTVTRLYDLPPDDTLWLDDDLLSLTTLTNGDATAITSTYYTLLPANITPKYAVKLKDTSGLTWLLNSSGSREQVISVAGTWGYVDRTATDANSAEVIRNTRAACIDIAVNTYQQRFGQLGESNVNVTAAGIVITPHGAVPKAAYDRIQRYMRVI